MEKFIHLGMYRENPLPRHRYRGYGKNGVDLGSELVTRREIDYTLHHEGKPVLAVQVHETSARDTFKFVIVPGYVLGRTDNVSSVEPVTDEKAREGIEGLVRNAKMEGPINFWPI